MASISIAYHTHSLAQPVSFAFHNLQLCSTLGDGIRTPNMSSPKNGSGSGSHHHQQPHTLQYRKPYESSDSDQNALQPLHDSIEQADHTVNPSNSNQTQSIPANPPSHGIHQSNSPPTSNQTHPILTNLPQTPTPKKPPTPTPSPHNPHSPHLTTTDIFTLAIALTPTLLHLYGRTLAQTPTPRQLGTWSALLTLPLSTPLYRCEQLPGPARDGLEVLSYGSAVTVTVDMAVVLYRYLAEMGPTSEAEWLAFCPAIVAGVACWGVVVGLLWGVVVVAFG